MSFDSLPNEVILNIASYIKSLRDVYSLCCINHRLSATLQEALFECDARNSRPYSHAINWAIKQGMIGLFETALSYGATIPLSSVTRYQASFINVQYSKVSITHPLVLATVYEQETFVDLLLERGCDPHMLDINGRSLLTVAVLKDNINLIKTFLGLKVRQSSGLFNGTRIIYVESSIEIAVRRGDEKLVKLLLMDGQNSPATANLQRAFSDAIGSGRKDLVLQLLGPGVNLNFKFSPATNRSKAYSPLTWAMDHLDPALVLTFLIKGALAENALLKAVDMASLELVKVLVNRSSGIVKTRALGRAVGRGNLAIAKMLLAYGTSCEFNQAELSSRLHRPTILKDVVEHNDFINPLVRAVQMGNTALSRLLLNHWADANTRYHSLQPLTFFAGRSCGSVLQLAMDLGYRKLVRLLVEFGADINLTDPSPTSFYLHGSHDDTDLLVRAVAVGGIDHVRILIANRGNIGCPDCPCVRAFHLATALGYETIAQELRDAGVNVTPGDSSVVDNAILENYTCPVLPRLIQLGIAPALNKVGRLLGLPSRRLKR